MIWPISSSVSGGVNRAALRHLHWIPTVLLGECHGRMVVPIACAQDAARMLHGVPRRHSLCTPQPQVSDREGRCLHTIYMYMYILLCDVCKIDTTTQHAETFRVAEMDGL